MAPNWAGSGYACLHCVLVAESWFQFADGAHRLIAGQVVPAVRPGDRQTQAVLVVVRRWVDPRTVRLTARPALRPHPAVGRYTDAGLVVRFPDESRGAVRCVKSLTGGPVAPITPARLITSRVNRACIYMHTF